PFCKAFGRLPIAGGDPANLDAGNGRGGAQGTPEQEPVQPEGAIAAAAEVLDALLGGPPGEDDDAAAHALRRYHTPVQGPTLDRSLMGRTLRSCLLQRRPRGWRPDEKRGTPQAPRARMPFSWPSASPS